MRKRKIRTNYENLRLDELHTLGGKVLDCLRDNASFIDLPIDITVFEDQITDFQQKWQTAKNGGSRWEKAVKDEAKKTLLDSFSRLAIYVNQVANGNLPQLLSSGFYLENEPKSLPLPGIPQLVEITDGSQSGQLALRFKPVKACWLYEYQYTHLVDETGQPIWEEILSTRKSMYNIIAPTLTAKLYYVRVRTRNGTGVSDWSPTVSLLAR